MEYCTPFFGDVIRGARPRRASSSTSESGKNGGGSLRGQPAFSKSASPSHRRNYHSTPPKQTGRKLRPTMHHENHARFPFSKKPTRSMWASNRSDAARDRAFQARETTTPG